MFRVKKSDDNLQLHSIFNNTIIKLTLKDNGKFSLFFENTPNIDELNMILAKEYDLFPPAEIVNDLIKTSLFNEKQPSSQLLDRMQQNLYAEIDEFRTQKPNQDQTLMMTPSITALNLFHKDTMKSRMIDELLMDLEHPSKTF